MRILLAISSSISAYKSPELVRLLKKNGHSVICIATENALKLVSKKALETVSENIVITDMWDSVNPLEHININKETDILLIAPATFNVIGKIANGIADSNFLSVAAAYTGRKIIAPAMNPQMWLNPVLQKNLNYLATELNYQIINPECGEVACGDKGVGRLASIEEIVSRVNHGNKLSNIKFAVTSGATKEWIDPIRYITNNSSGKMGHAIYEEIINNGGNCVYIEGNVEKNLSNYNSINTKKIKVETTDDLKNAVHEAASEVDILIMAAAPLDFKPTTISNKKIKKQDINSIDLENTSDILKSVADVNYKNLIVVAFAAETADSDAELEKLAIEKMNRKKADMIVGNIISDAIGMSTNKITIFFKDEIKKEYPVMSKSDCAKNIIDEALRIFSNKKN